MREGQAESCGKERKGGIVWDEPVEFRRARSLWPVNTVWRKLLYSGFETCFGLSTQGAGLRYQNTSQIQILLASHCDKRGAMLKCVIGRPWSGARDTRSIFSTPYET